MSALTHRGILFVFLLVPDGIVLFQLSPRR